MELKPGYKQTEVGVIPEEWDQTEIGNRTVKVGSGITPTGGVRVYRQSGRPFVRSQNVGRGSLLLDDIAFIDDQIHESFSATEIAVGDVFLNITGASIGRSAVADARVRGGNVNQHVCIIRPKAGELDSRFLNHFLLSTSGQRQIDSFQAGGNRQGLNFGQIRSFRLPLPPFPEQRAIAGTLGDVDALLGALTRLIAKKRDLKQAAMQQLLTGKKRLPGFRGEWEVVKAGYIGRFRGGSGFPTKFQGATSGAYPFFKVSDMNNEGNETFMETANNYISEALRKQLRATAFPAESIVFAKVGAAVFLERKKILAKASCLDNNMAALVLDGSRANYRFIHYVLLNTNLGDLVSTTALPSLSGSVLAQIELALPALPEQTAIAAVLSDMDAEIAALEARLTKTRALKQGMMQELLTGKTRLV